MKADLHSYIMHSDTHKGHAEKPYKQHEHVKKYEKQHNRLFFLGEEGGAWPELRISQLPFACCKIFPRASSRFP